MTHEKVLERGDVVEDKDGTKWRIVAVLKNGNSRVKVGSIAEEIIFGPISE